MIIVVAWSRSFKVIKSARPVEYEREIHNLHRDTAQRGMTPCALFLALPRARQRSEGQEIKGHDPPVVSREMETPQRGEMEPPAPVIWRRIL
jgi:hypothetical protein